MWFAFCATFAVSGNISMTVASCLAQITFDSAAPCWAMITSASEKNAICSASDIVSVITLETAGVLAPERLIQLIMIGNGTAVLSGPFPLGLVGMVVGEARATLDQKNPGTARARPSFGHRSHRRPGGVAREQDVACRGELHGVIVGRVIAALDRHESQPIGVRCVGRRAAVASGLSQLPVPVLVDDLHAIVAELPDDAIERTTAPDDEAIDAGVLPHA